MKRACAPLLVLLTVIFGASAAGGRPADSLESTPAPAAPFAIDGYASDPDYGYRPTKPIQLGGIDLTQPPEDYDLAERKALIQQLLKGPLGQPLTWERVKPCCPLGPAQGGAEGEGLLDVYLVSVPGQRPVRLFVNHYKAGPVHAPVGFAYHRTAEAARGIEAAMALAEQGDSDRAIGMLKPHAEAGDVLARFYLGALHLRAKNAAEAMRWFEQAAAQDHGPSQLTLASAYRKGRGVEKDDATAKRWLIRAARNRDALARLHLAQIEGGQSRQTGDWREANYHLYLAAEQGVAAAQRANGKAFIDGTGREKDMRTGLFWLAAADFARDAGASELFEKYCAPLPAGERRAIEQRARDFWQKPQPSDHVATLTYRAASRNSHARYALGVITMTGIEIEADREAGLLMIALAAAAGDERAARTFAGFEKTEPAELIARIKQSAEALADTSAK